MHVQTQPVRVLGMLLERAGRLVTRQEIVDHLWPGHTVEEFDDNLNSTVKKLREALGDDAGKPLYIETVPRRGYRFIAPVEVEMPEVVESPAEAASEERRSGEPNSKRNLKRIAVALGLILVAGIAGSMLVSKYSKQAAAEIQARSIAVLPFENLTGDASQDYFAEGLTDAVTTDLAQLGTLKVISRASASHFKTNQQTLRQIREELGVDAVVEGTFARSRDKVRVNARLVSTIDDRSLWAQTFERDTGDIVSLQDDLAESVADRVQATISPELRTRFNEAHSVNVEAYQAYLSGMHDLNYHRTNNELQKSLEAFDQATKLDPKLAAAYAGKAIAYNLLGDYDAMKGAEAGPKAEATARQALSIDPSLASAHAALAFALWKYDWNWKEAQAEFRKSLELNANNAHTHHIYAVYLACRGEFADAEQHMHKALELDPLSMIIRTNLGWMRYFQGDFAGAETAYLDVLKVDPGFLPARQKLWITYAEEGKTEQAAAELENLMRLFGHESLLRKAEHAKPAGRYLADIRAYVDAGVLSAYERARYEALLGRKREALQALSEAAAQRSAWIVYLQIEPVFEGLKSEPEFARLAQQANFPEAARVSATK